MFTLLLTTCEQNDLYTPVNDAIKAERYVQISTIYAIDESNIVVYFTKDLNPTTVSSITGTISSGATVNTPVIGANPRILYISLSGTPDTIDHITSNTLTLNNIEDAYGYVQTSVSGNFVGPLSHSFTVGTNSKFMDLAAIGSSIYGIIYDNINGRIVLNYSSNAGYSFYAPRTHPVSISGPIKLKAIEDRDGDGNDLYVIAKTDTDKLLIGKSIDGGINWNFAEIASITDTTISNYYSLAIAPHASDHRLDRVYVSRYKSTSPVQINYTSFQLSLIPSVTFTYIISDQIIQSCPAEIDMYNSIDVIAGAASDGSNDKIYIAYVANNSINNSSYPRLFKTYDNGTTFNHITIDSEVSNSKIGFHNSISVLNDGSNDWVLTCYQEIDTGGNYNIKFASSTDGGNTFADQTLNTTPSSTEIGKYTHISYSNSYVYLSHYKSGTPGTIGFYRNWNYGAATWSPERTITGINDNHAPIVTTGDGTTTPFSRLYTMFITGSGPYNLSFYRSLDKGNTWP